MGRRITIIKLIFNLGMIGIILFLSSCQSGIESITPDTTVAATSIPHKTSTITQTPTASFTPTVTPSATPIPTSTSTIPPTVTYTPSPTPIGGGRGFIYFSGCKDRVGCGLYRIRMDDISVQEIFPPSERIYSYQFSPDQTKIAYVIGPYPDKDGVYIDYDIRVMDLKTKKKTNLAGQVDPTYMKWSPDSSKVAFISYQELDSANVEWNRIYVVDADGKHKKVVNGEVTAWDHWLLWTADSQSILFSGGVPFRLLEIKGNQMVTEPVDGSDDPYWASLYMVKSDGADLKRISPERQVRDFWNFDWIDDGRRVIANTNLCPFAGCSQNFVRIIDLETGEIIQIDPKEVSMDNLALSPDLNHNVSWCQYFTCDVSYQSIDGLEKKVLGRGIYWDTVNGFNDLQTWSPDGGHIALVAYSSSDVWENATSALFLDNVRDNKPGALVTKWLYRGSRNVYGWHWSWSPDGRFIVYTTPYKTTFYLLDLSDLDHPAPQVLYEGDELKSTGQIYWQP